MISTLILELGEKFHVDELEIATKIMEPNLFLRQVRDDEEVCNLQKKEEFIFGLILFLPNFSFRRFAGGVWIPFAEDWIRNVR